AGDQDAGAERGLEAVDEEQRLQRLVRPIERLERQQEPDRHEGDQAEGTEAVLRRLLAMHAEVHRRRGRVAPSGRPPWRASQAWSRSRITSASISSASQMVWNANSELRSSEATHSRAS